jgi:hypothetical protein
VAVVDILVERRSIRILRQAAICVKISDAENVATPSRRAASLTRDAIIDAPLPCSMRMARPA